MQKPPRSGKRRRSSPARPCDVGLLDGSTLTGTLSDVSADKIVVESDDKTMTLPSERLLSVAPKTSPEPSTENPTAWIELVDGSKLTDDNFVLAKDGQSGAADWYGQGTGALRHRAIFAPGDPASPVWPEKIAADATGDLVVVRKKDAVDFLEGQIESVEQDSVVLRMDGQPYPIAREKVDGMIFYHKAGEALPEAACVVETNRGWQLQTRRIVPFRRIEKTERQIGQWRRISLAVEHRHAARFFRRQNHLSQRSGSRIRSLDPVSRFPKGLRHAGAVLRPAPRRRARASAAHDRRENVRQRARPL